MIAKRDCRNRVSSSVLKRRTNTAPVGGVAEPADLELVMTLSLPLVVTPYAAILGLLGAALTVNVIVNRVKGGVTSGDGGVPRLTQAIRAHCNFTEQAPIALIVILVAEAARARPLKINILGALLVISRLASAYTLNQTLNNTWLRVLGGGLAVLVLATASIVALIAMAGFG
jgi:uncharacterized membrane protein YecN with MAPEG domain